MKTKRLLKGRNWPRVGKFVFTQKVAFVSEDKETAEGEKLAVGGKVFLHAKRAICE